MRDCQTSAGLRLPPTTACGLTAGAREWEPWPSVREPLHAAPNKRPANIRFRDSPLFGKRVQSSVGKIVGAAQILGDVRRCSHLKFPDTVQKQLSGVLLAELSRVLITLCGHCLRFLRPPY